MHPLHHSLAHILVGDENFHGDFSKLRNSIMSPPQPRRLHLDCNTGSVSSLDALREKVPVRTLYLTSQDRSIQGNAPRHLLKGLPALRLVHCKGLSLTKLPKCLGYSIHLRYLNLYGSSIIEIPKSLGNLQNLQFIFLDECPNLEKLPKEVASLYNLRALCVGGTTNIRGMPKGLGKLPHLNDVDGFTVNGSNSGGSSRSRDQFCSLEELSSLSQLRMLGLKNLSALLPSRSHDLQPRKFLLKNKLRLDVLHVDVGDRMQLYGEEEAKRLQGLLEFELRPPPSLEECYISDYFGLHYPDWMGPRDIKSFSNLKRVNLKGWSGCRRLPPLGLLPYLAHPFIEDFEAVEHIGPEFMVFSRQETGTSRPPLTFQKLNTLFLQNMPNLVTWEWESAATLPNVAESSTAQTSRTPWAMPGLSLFNISSCPKLRALPAGLGQLTASEFIVIEEADSLKSIEDLPNIKSCLYVGCSHGLVRLRNLSSLERLIVDTCTALQEVTGLHSLKFLGIGEFGMDCIPKWLLPTAAGGESPFPQLQYVNITVRDVRRLRRYRRGGPCWQSIQHLPCVRINLDDTLEYIEYNRDPFFYDTNVET